MSFSKSPNTIYNYLLAAIRRFVGHLPSRQRYRLSPVALGLRLQDHV
jgi:hypothetical protein